MAVAEVHPTELPADESALTELLETGEADRCVSIYLPTHARGPQRVQDPIRLRNLLTVVEKSLSEKECNSDECDELLRPAQALLEDRDFWRKARHGLALFMQPGRCSFMRLDYDVPELVFIADHFALRCVLPAITNQMDCLLLSLSAGATTAHRVDSQGLKSIELPDTPTSMKELAAFIEAQKSMQWHTGTSPSPGPQMRSAVFHGQGGARDDSDTRLRELLTLVDRGLQRALRGSRLPLILAGDERVITMFRSITSHPNVSDQAVIGNVEHLSDLDLHERVQAIIDDVVAARNQSELDRYEQAKPHGRGIEGTKEIASAAAAGRIDCLLASMPTQSHEKPKNSHGVSKPNDAGNGEKTERAIIDTLSHGGRVLVVPARDWPHGSQIVAIVRPGGTVNA